MGEEVAATSIDIEFESNPYRAVIFTKEYGPNEFRLDEFTKSLYYKDNTFNLSYAVALLDDCKNNTSKIIDVYNGHINICNSPLYLIIHAKFNPQDKVKPQRLLAHSVMQKIVHMKWENFAKRMYLQQLILHCLLVMAMSLSMTMTRVAEGAQSESNHTATASNQTAIAEDFSFPHQLTVWLYVGTTLCIVLLTSLWYKPSHSSEWKGWTIFLLVVWYIALYFLSPHIKSSMDSLWFVRGNNIVVALIALYFLVMEIEEWSPQQPMPKATGVWDYIFNKVGYVIVFVFSLILYFLCRLFFWNEKEDYYSSAFNHFQIPTYVAALLYVLNEFIAFFSHDAQIYLGIILSFALWVFSLEYLEVHPTAGYLLPMMRSMASDMVRFLIFYAPFQFAYTCAYFLLFQDKNVPQYSNIGESFITTFLVVLGQINLDPFNDLSGFAYVLGYTTLLSHATLVMVMLLNVIVAMMNKTMEDNFEQAKMKAIISFAECVLRCEKTAGLKRIDHEESKNQDAAFDAQAQESDTTTTTQDATAHDTTTHNIKHDCNCDEDDFELEETSADDLIKRLEAELNATSSRTESLEKKMDQVLDLLLELKKHHKHFSC